MTPITGPQTKRRRRGGPTLTLERDHSQPSNTLHDGLPTLALRLVVLTSLQSKLARPNHIMHPRCASSLYPIRAACLAALMLMACNVAPKPAPTPTSAPARLRVVTDLASVPLAQALMDAYTATHPHVMFSVEWAGTTGAFDAIYANRTDFAIVSRLLPLPEGKISPWNAELAQDGVAVVVNPQNPIENLSAFELREVFAGARSRWSDVGQPQMGDIDLATRDAAVTERTVFDGAVMGRLELSRNAIVLPSVEVMQNFVAIKPGAIGYIPASRLAAPAAPKVKAISIEGQKLTPESIANGTYKLTHSLYLLSPFEPQWEARVFAIWSLNAEGQRVVERARYVPITK